MSRLAISRRFRRLASALALLSLVADAGGCVERRMTIRSNPPGAAVYVDDYQIGTTPVAVNYTYYGTRKIRLVKDGFETLTVYQPMPAPWYDYFGIDFFSENIWPGKIRDERSYDFQMSPIVMVPNDQLLNRAEQLRNNGRAIPAAAVEPIVTGPSTSVPPVEMLPVPGALPPTDTLPPLQQYTPPGSFPQPSTISSPINSAPSLPPSSPYAPPGTAPSYAPQGSSVYPPAGGTVSPPPGSAAPMYTPPPAYGPGFSSPGGFGVGGSAPQYGPQGGLFPESAPTTAPQYVPPPTTAPPVTAPPAAAPIPYSVPQGWHPMGQLPASSDAPVIR